MRIPGLIPLSGTFDEHIRRQGGVEDFPGAFHTRDRQGVRIEETQLEQHASEERGSLLSSGRDGNILRVPIFG